MSKQVVQVIGVVYVTDQHGSHHKLTEKTLCSPTSEGWNPPAGWYGKPSYYMEDGSLVEMQEDGTYTSIDGQFVFTKIPLGH